MVEDQLGYRPPGIGDFASLPDLNIEPISPSGLIETLELLDSPRPLLNSVRESLWGRVADGRIVLESRNLSILKQPRGGVINVYDFDDCLASATRWHQQEYQLLEQSEALRGRGINIDAQKAREIYELSKIRIPQVAEKEPRYTPRLNLALLSIYASALVEGQQKGFTPEQAWQELMEWREMIEQQVQNYGERVLKAYTVNSTVQKIFMDNSPADFLYADFVRDVLGRTGPGDIRIIATRGKIEGPLGQVYKVHTSGLMRPKAFSGQGIDLAVYSNDVKAEALLSMLKLLPSVGERLIRIFDDNPAEIMPYLAVARSLGARNIEVIQVSHPDAKRKDASLEVEPTLVYMAGETRMRQYSPAHGAPNP